MNEIKFVFLKNNGFDVDSDEIISISSPDEINKNSTVVVSNSIDVSHVIYAPEINFYLKNTQDDTNTSKTSLLTLYKLRYLKYTSAVDIPEYKKISNTILVVDYEQTQEKKNEFIKSLEKEEKFSISYAESDNITSVKGTIGELTVSLKDGNQIKVDQIIWFNLPEEFERVGIYDPLQSSLNLKDKLISNLENGYGYKRVLKYDYNICQYHDRTPAVCGLCTEICPVEAVIKVEDEKRLKFIEVNCTGCGGCVSICPSGALDYAETSRDIFHLMSKAFKDKIPLIIPEDANIENMDIPLKKNVLPFVIGGKKFLDETHFLMLAQESGSQIVLYNASISKGTQEAMRFVNEIYIRKYNKPAVLLATSKKELEKALEEADFIQESQFSIYTHEYDKKREIFAKRVKHIVKDENLGLFKTGEFIHYGNIEIDTDKCTLCMSCAGGCNVKALFPEEQDNTLRFNASSCTFCGYCELVCPEECLKIVYDEVELSPAWFEDRVMAKDEVFRCIECGKPFAPAKSIKKIAEKMIAMWGEDDPRVKTLYCCPECKPKVMLKYQIKVGRKK